jgi:hypothetical protein
VHRNLAGIWTEIDRDSEMRASERRRGRGLGGRDLVYNLLNCSKP